MDITLPALLDTFTRLSRPEDETDIGLYTGKTGSALLYYLAGALSGQQAYSTAAETMMDEVSEQINEVDSMNYYSGLAGIGWAIEWLARNRFVEVNTDEFLEEMDTALYNRTIIAAEDTTGLFTGTLGKITYFRIRHQSRNPGTHRMRRLYNEMCLVILTDELKERLLDEGGILPGWKYRQPDPEAIQTLAQALLFTSDFLPDRVNINPVELTLYESIRFTDVMLPHTIELLRNGSLACTAAVMAELQYLAWCYCSAGAKHDNNSWQQKGREYLKALLTLPSQQEMQQDELSRAAVYHTIMRLCLPEKDELHALLPASGMHHLSPHHLKTVIQEVMLTMILHWQEKVLQPQEAI